jgi:lipid-binding SYLF domain-containing protein
MRTFITSLTSVLSLLSLLGLQACSTAPTTPSQVNEQRAAIEQMANQTLAQVYQQYPNARARIRNATGYAVFSDQGGKFLYGGVAQGAGVAVNNLTGQETFMKMVELQPGFGFGISKFRVVLVFATPQAFNHFVTSGWEFGASASAAAKTASMGSSYLNSGVVVSPGVTMYQLTEAGVIVGVSITGAKYYRDEALN